MDRQLTDRSSLVFNGSHSLLNYNDNGTQNVSSLSNQQRISGYLGYSHSLFRGSWSVGYSGSRSAFSKFDSSHTYAAQLGYDRQLSKSMSLSLSGGPSYGVSQGNTSSHLGVNASIALHRSIRNGGFSLTFSNTANDSSGYGSISTYQQAGLSGSHSLGRHLSLSLDISGYNTIDRTLSEFNTRGFSAGGSLGYSVARRWSMNFGGQYQHYDANANTQVTQNQKRIFVSMRFHNPDLWRF
jgi:hypothetical protein